MGFESFDQGQHVLGCGEQKFLVLTGFIVRKQRVFLVHHVAVAQGLIEPPVGNGVGLA